jgi:PadR family transcriptional regulator PadR
MRRLSITAVSVLHAIADGYQYGFDVIDQTGLPSGTVYPALSRRRMPMGGRRVVITS